MLRQGFLHHLKTNQRTFGQFGAAPVMGQRIAHHIAKTRIVENGFFLAGGVGVARERLGQLWRAAIRGGAAPPLQGCNLWQQPFHRRKNLLLQEAILQGGSRLVQQALENQRFIGRQVGRGRTSFHAQNTQHKLLAAIVQGMYPVIMP